MTGLRIYDLRRNQCRFAITPDHAAEHFFCGEPVEYDGCPYCPAHAARCFDRRAAEMRRAHAERAAVMRAAKKTVSPVTGRRPLVGPNF